jgi:hypothetical protein
MKQVNEQNQIQERKLSDRPVTLGKNYHFTLKIQFCQNQHQNKKKTQPEGFVFVFFIKIELFPERTTCKGYQDNCMEGRLVCITTQTRQRSETN